MNSAFVLQASTEGPVYAQFAEAEGKNASSTLEHRGFSPYDFNGGTVAAIAGPDYCVVASDTRLSSGYEILSRDVSKVHSLGAGVLASSGSKNDVDQLRSWMDIKLKIYEHNHQKQMSLDSVAQLLSNTLYHKRFFPYYTFNLLAGIDSEGKGAVFSYDAIGSFEKTAYSASGSGQAYVIPLLDNCVGLRNRLNTAEPIAAEEVVELLKDAFLSAGERDIYTGDQVEFHVIKASGVEVQRFNLKAD